MTYKALARQWRPKTFAEVIGQEYTVRALSNAIKHGRLHHAYLFTGTRGIGKTTLARILAKSLNCERNDHADKSVAVEHKREVNPEPCGLCAACVSIDQGNFVDLIEVDAASKTKVEDTRDLLERASYMPSQGRYKVYLIDEVHMLSGHSFNSLLKTLEEPPGHVKFLLATTDPQKIPATVMSRCLQFNLKPVAEKTIAQYLEQVLTQEGVVFESPALLTIARHATGSIRDALSLTDQAIAFTDSEISLDKVEAMLGILGVEAVRDLLGFLIADDAKGMLDHIAVISEQTVDLLSVLDQLLELLQKVAVIQQVPDPDLCRDGIYAYAILEELGKQLSPEDCQLFYQIGLMGKKDWHLAGNAKSYFEMVFLRMLSFRPYRSRPERKNQTSEQAPQQLVKKMAEKAVPLPIPQETQSSSEITAENWVSFIQEAKLSAFAKSLMKQAQWLQQTEDGIFLELSEGHYALWEEAYKREIEQLLTEHMDKPVKLDVRCAAIAQVASEQEPVKQETVKADVPEQAAPRDEKLDLLLKAFDGELVGDKS